MKYQNRKNGKIGEVIAMSEDTFTLRLEDGIDKEYNRASFGKSWKLVAEEEVVEDVAEETAVLEDPVEEVAVVQPIDIAEQWLKSHGIKYDRSRDGMRVFTDADKHWCELWKRKNCVRMYVNAVDMQSVDQKLLERVTATVAGIAKRYDTSLFVPTANIDAVFAQMFVRA